MNKQCAWCKETTLNSPGIEVSHGICEECLKEKMEENEARRSRAITLKEQLRDVE